MNSTNALDITPLLCPFIAMLDIFTLKKDTTEQHCDNAGLNVQNNASLAIY
jgi:hypothetical protein